MKQHYFQLFTVVLAYIGHEIRREASKTSLICFKMARERWRKSGLYPNENVLRSSDKHLTFLSKQATLLDPKLSAVGFFTIDNTMLFTLTVSVANYFVVLTQLDDKLVGK